MTTARQQAKTAMIIGMARSGVSAAKLLLEQGVRVIINDTKTPDGVLSQFTRGSVVDALGKDPEDYLAETDMLVLSPGVPMSIAAVAQAKARGIEVLGEIELAYRYMRAPIVAITGTNGKTTTTALTGEMFKAGGFHTFVCGNIGVPMCDFALETTEQDVVVAEVAGFQLESSSTFRPRAAAILNLTNDHLDRFKTMQNYGDAKKMILANQTPEDTAVLHLDDPLVMAMGEGAKAQMRYFSRTQPVDVGACVVDGCITLRDGNRETRVLPASELRIPGPHNLENALAAAALAHAMGVDHEAMAEAMRTFPGVEHRIEFVRCVGGVNYINDSKGTNPDATIKAVASMDKPTVLLLGGYDKKSDFTALFEAFTPHIRAIVVYGETMAQIVETAQRLGFCSVHTAHTMEEAVFAARELCPPGGNVLLSPACASYDMFSDFEHRGREFKRIVMSIKE